MRSLYVFVLAALLFGCGNPTVKKTDAPDYFRENVRMLDRAGLLKNFPAAKQDSLIAIYQKDSVNGLKELLVASGDLLKIHVKRNGRTLQDVYQRICDTIGMKYPELKCDEVQTSLLPNKPGGKDTGWVLLKVRFGQTWYERKLYYFHNWEIDDFVYRIYNRKLADDGKPVRLHLVEYTCPDCAKTQDDYMGTTDVTRYGYLMLTKAQEDSLLNIPSLEMEPEYEFSIFTTAEMDAQLKKFEASGLPGVIGENWYEGVKTDIYQSAIYKQRDFYDFLDTLFATTILDTGNAYNPYEQVLTALARASRGKFNPTAIVDNETAKNKREVHFTFEGDVYSFEAEQRGGYLFPGIIDNVNKALADHKTGGAFYTISTEDNFCMLIYLDDGIVEKVKASGFFLQFEKGPSQEIKGRWEHGVNG